MSIIANAASDQIDLRIPANEFEPFLAECTAL